MDELQARHRKELKDLQGKITSKKKNATKKTRKGVNDECAALEKDVRDRHAAEMAALHGAPVDGDDGDAATADQAIPEDPAENGHGVEEGILADRVKSVRFDDDGGEPIDDDDDDNAAAAADAQAQPGKKKNRQKARLARRAAEQEAVAAQAAEEAASMPDLRKTERLRMMEEFDRRGLEEKAVAANGHCLYSAVADQIYQLGLQVKGFDLDQAAPAKEPDRDAYKLVRHAAASYISEHSDDFVPFLEEPLDDYVHKVKDTGEWGGQLELLALAKTYKMDIHVLQGDGRVEKIEGGAPTEQHPAWLAYYRHGFGLGEHYNSLRRTAKRPPAPEAPAAAA